MFNISKNHIITVAALIIASNLLMIALFLTPDVAFGSVKTENYTHVDIPGYSLYDHVIYEDDLYFLAREDGPLWEEKNVKLGIVSRDVYEIINDDLGNSTSFDTEQATQAPSLIGVYQNEVYIDLTPNMLIDEDDNPKTVFVIYDLNGNEINVIENTIIAPGNRTFAEYYIFQAMIVNDNLYYGQLYYSQFVEPQFYLFSQDLSEPDYRITMLKISEFVHGSFNLFAQDNNLYLLNGFLSGMYQLQSVSPDLSLTNITKFSMGEDRIQYGSEGKSQNFIFLSEDKIYKLDKRFNNGKSILIFNSTLEDQQYRVAYNQSIRDIHLTGDGRFIILTGYYPVQQNLKTKFIPHISILRLVGNTIEKLEIKSGIIPDVGGTIHSPLVHEGSISLILNHYNSTDEYYTSSLIFVENGLRSGIFLQGVSPAIQINTVALLLSILYIVSVIIRNRNRTYPDDLEYPQN